MEQKLITRAEQKPEDCWDLSSLYVDNQAWEKDLPRFRDYGPRLATFQGRLHEGNQTLKAYLDLSTEAEILGEQLGHYAFLRISEDAGDAGRQDMLNRFSALETELAASQSWFAPELLALPKDQLEGFLTSDLLKEYRISLAKLIRRKDHVLGAEGENILALMSDVQQTPHTVFGSLVDIDFDFGTVEGPQGPVPLSHGSFQFLLQQSDRELRARTFAQYYKVFDQHKNTLANTYLGSLRQDVFNARARKYPSSLAMALFPDKVPETVYTRLIAQVRERLPVLHRYYALRARIMKLDKLELWDTKTSLVPDVAHHMPYGEAVNLILEALAPLGHEYVDTLGQGLRGRWVDRYENKGKRSGAFSAGSFSSDPFILMNYRADNIRDVFTLAHEAGHSMHSWYSSRSNPFPHYHYTIFEAEIASTFNEQLLFRHWSKNLGPGAKQLYLVNKQIDDMLATIFRQTMFAEYELHCHRTMEETGALNVDALRSAYRELLDSYFGPSVRIDPVADLEGLRIPHFYRAFYVYKYATGLSASVALANQVLHGGAEARDRYFAFLRSGGSRYPLESVRAAGIDMEEGTAVKEALDVFASLVDQLEAGLAGK